MIWDETCLIVNYKFRRKGYGIDTSVSFSFFNKLDVCIWLYIYNIDGYNWKVILKFLESNVIKNVIRVTENCRWKTSFLFVRGTRGMTIFTFLDEWKVGEKLRTIVFSFSLSLSPSAGQFWLFVNGGHSGNCEAPVSEKTNFPN